MVSNSPSLIMADTGLSAYRQIIQEHRGKWLFGHVSYDFKNTLFPHLIFQKQNLLGFPNMSLFAAEIVVEWQQNALTIHSSLQEPTIIWKEINSIVVLPEKETRADNTVLCKPQITQEQYINNVNNVLDHIAKGDCYEINYCQEFTAADVALNPVATYWQLQTISPTPFSVYFKHQHLYALCASPERYVQKKDNQLITQPIKGTLKRTAESVITDREEANALLNSEKNRAENVMIVDLMRNDLSHICQRGSGKVEELFGIYSFPQVHQMRSTVVGTIDPSINWADVLQATFPMGSMTGAPKEKVLALTEQYEATARGLYSGTIFYQEPNGNFDANVVIRTILYNELNRFLSFHVGGGITANSDPQDEYAECLVKASAILQALNAKIVG